MKVCGFSFIRNAITYDYPVEEALRSILPLCSEVVVAVGHSEDDTLKLVRSIDKKVKVIETTWDETLKEGGKVLAKETNKALQAIPSDADWCFYIQGDEVLHERFLEPVRRTMEEHLHNPRVDGLLLNYLHFFGSYDYVATAPNWYRREIRVIRNDRSIYSFKDAQGFRKKNNQKLSVKPVDARIYHYGWVKHPEIQLKKHRAFHKLYHDTDWADHHMYKSEEFDYSIIDELEKFKGTHPAVMQERIRAKNWFFDRDLSFNRLSSKNRIKKFFQKYFGFIPGEYRNYRIIS